jgi:hypothetical protein
MKTHLLIISATMFALLCVLDACSTSGAATQGMMDCVPSQEPSQEVPLNTQLFSLIAIVDERNPLGYVLIREQDFVDGVHTRYEPIRATTVTPEGEALLEEPQKPRAERKRKVLPETSI